MVRLPIRRISLTIAVAALVVATAIAAPERAPKLVVLLMVDQFRAAPTTSIAFTRSGVRA